MRLILAALMLFAAPADALRVAFVGDSLTATAATRADDPWAHQIEHRSLGEHQCGIAALGGATVQEIQDQYTDEIKGNNFDVLVILAGINNVNADNDGGDIWNNLEALIDEALTDGLFVITLTLAPEGTFSGHTASRQTAIDEVNTSILAKVAPDYYTIDIYAPLERPDGSDDLDRDAGVDQLGAFIDGLHWGPEGNRIVRDLVETQINALDAGSGDAGAPDPVEALRTASVIWIEGINIDGSDNATLTDEDPVATIFNPGTLGNLTQAAAAQRAVFDDAILNSNPVLRFDGSDDNYPLIDAESTNFIWESGDFEIAVVALSTSTSVNRPIIGCCSTGTQTGYLLQFHATNQVRWFIMNGALVINRSTGSISPDTWYAFGARGDGTNSGPTVDLTTYNEGVMSGLQPDAGPATDTIAIFQQGATGSLRTAGSLAFIAVFSSELSDPDRATLRTYVNDTWGFSL